MTLQKPRAPGSADEALERMIEEIALAHGGDAGGSLRERGIALAAAFEERSASVLRKQLDPDSKDEFSFRRVGRLVKRFGVRAPLDYFAAALGIVVPEAPHAGAVPAPAEGLIAVTRHATAVINDGWEAWADGRLTANEKAQLRLQIQKLRQALRAFDAVLAQGADE